MSKSNEYQTKNQESEFPVFLCVPGKVQYETPGLYDFKIRGLRKMVSGTPTFQFILLHVFKYYSRRTAFIGLKVI